jgi:hypothetical protein
MIDSSAAFELAFERGRTDRIADLKGKHHRNKLKMASDLFPSNDACFEAYVSGWNSVWEAAYGGDSSGA